jgi:hypothetical protein
MKEAQFVKEARERGVRISTQLPGRYFTYYATDEERRYYFDNDCEIPPSVSAEHIVQIIQAENAARKKPGVPQIEVTHC